MIVSAHRALAWLWPIVSTIVLAADAALPWAPAGGPLVLAADQHVQHVVGIVAAVDQQHLVVTTFKGQTISIKLTKQVRYKDKTNPHTNRPPAVGDRVIVEAVRSKKTLTAVTVHYSPTSQRSSSSDPPD